jgi:hypothetical protein
MGTRSLTYIYNDADMPLVCIYRQYDGFPSVHGAELAEVLNETKNNGIECLSASIVGKLKNGEWGNTYLYPPFAEQDCGQDFEYIIKDDLVMVMQIGMKGDKIKLFEGFYSEFRFFCKGQGNKKVA